MNLHVYYIIGRSSNCDFDLKIHLVVYAWRRVIGVLLFCMKGKRRKTNFVKYFLLLSRGDQQVTSTTVVVTNTTIIGDNTYKLNQSRTMTKRASLCTTTVRCVAETITQ